MDIMKDVISLQQFISIFFLKVLFVNQNIAQKELKRPIFSIEKHLLQMKLSRSHDRQSMK